MSVINSPKSIYEIDPDRINFDFVVGEDNFQDVHISSVGGDGYWYFENSKKSLIKRFILQRTDREEKYCYITLKEDSTGELRPRFTFQVFNITKNALKEYAKENMNHSLIKSNVDFSTCSDNFLLLLNFLKSLSGIGFDSDSYAVVDKAKKDIFDNIDKGSAIAAFTKKYGTDISDHDVDLLQSRRSKLDHFLQLLLDRDFFESEKQSLGKNKRNEDVWQNFFENNSWIFGYGLQLVACEGLDDKKLEQTIVGNDLMNGAGKRIDALLKTKGSISKLLFCEIKTHLPNLLLEDYDRPGVFVPAEDLRGAVAQIQKTIHKATVKLQENFIRPKHNNGDPTGEELLFVKPRGIVVIGKLDDFKTAEGINYEKLSSFELYRQQVNGIEIITFDELYERARFIVGS